ncbi:flagellin [Geodermatophilus sp. DSM 44513]|uniref:flagellin N-terminal helical domain-containing protein n=1 Tax=Geodermatophilus sp. DSM 44513 TaxID=1528104 RepID=UPI0028F707BB|nr:flagellin [Geodermatophilus sp. DSM 44513]WNV76474.1 flagellin [Geodermatophilus sp. DSM 44513]
MSVNTNIGALNSYRNLSVTNDQMGKSLERLSSGFRINRAADDAAGLAISEGLRSQIGGMKQAVRNTQDAISVVQTAEGALGTTTTILQRMRDLSVQASNSGSLNDDAKSSIQKEMGELKSELSRIAEVTNFNGTKLLDGNFTGKSFQVGANASESIQVNIGTAMGAAGLNVDGVDVTGEGAYTNGTGAGTVSTANATDAAAAVLTFTAATGDDFSAAGTVASYENLEGTVSFGGKSFDLGTVDYGAAADADNSGTTTNAEALVALNAAATSALGLTTNPFALATTNLTFTVGDAVEGYTDGTGTAIGTTAEAISKATPTFAAASGATQAIKDIDAAIKTVSSVRADLGAKQNRFEHTINNLNVAVENTTASESRIRDTDMAQEMTNFTRTQILAQAGTAMLAQANQSSQGLLRLLG